MSACPAATLAAPSINPPTVADAARAAGRSALETWRPPSISEHGRTVADARRLIAEARSVVLIIVTSTTDWLGVNADRDSLMFRLGMKDSACPFPVELELDTGTAWVGCWPPSSRLCLVRSRRKRRAGRG